MPIAEFISQNKYSLKTFEQLQFENLDIITNNEATKFFNRIFINKNPFFLKITTKEIEISEDDRTTIRYVCEKFFKAIKLNTNIPLQSILSQFRNSKKQHPTYQNVMKELEGKNYEKAILGCKEFLEIFPNSYSNASRSKLLPILYVRPFVLL